MIRYTINFEERMLEKEDNGKWVKFEDMAQVEALAHQEAELKAYREMEKERERLKAQDQQIATLSEELATALLSSQNAQQQDQAVIERYRFMLKAAKDRLKLLGHAPNCFSRYGEVSADGHQAVNECNCGLDEWFRETGVAHG